MKEEFKGKKVYHYTVGRSGSTLISQILRDLFGENNVKAGHEPVFCENGEPIIISYRDPRDVLVSLWRTNKNISLQRLDSGLKISGGELVACLNVVCDTYKGTATQVKNRNPHALLLRYEDFCGDRFDYIFNNLEKYFEMKISKSKKEELAKTFSFAENKKRSDKMKEWLKWDNYMIHGKHVHKGKIGAWKDIVPENLHGLMNQRMKPFLDQWGYKV